MTFQLLPFQRSANEVPLLVSSPNAQTFRDEVARSTRIVPASPEGSLACRQTWPFQRTATGVAAEPVPMLPPAHALPAPVVSTASSDSAAEPLLAHTIRHSGADAAAAGLAAGPNSASSAEHCSGQHRAAKGR